MTEPNDDAERVSESQATYGILPRVRDRKAMREAARQMDEFRKRHAEDPSDGKDVVTLLREWRYH